jgi:3-hydroxyisobutyrate dehydrogenase
MNQINSKPRVSLFGLGIMGSGMAHRLLGAGLPLSVFNRTSERTLPFAAKGARVAATAAEAAADADILISMLADDVASREVWTGAHGALAGARSGAVLIESSTLSLSWVKELAAAASNRGCELLDAPVTGSKANAAAGELTFLVGGNAAALEKARPAFVAMGRAVMHVGPTGSGALLKLINNFLCGVQAVSLGEALALIERSGLDRSKSIEFLKNAAPGSPIVRTLADRMMGEQFEPNFKLRLLAKDLAYAEAEAGNVSLDLCTATAAIAILKKAIAQGLGEQDMAAVVKASRTPRSSS